MGKVIAFRRGWSPDGEIAVGEKGNGVEQVRGHLMTNVPLPENYNQVLLQLIDDLRPRKERTFLESYDGSRRQRLLITSFEAKHGVSQANAVLRLAEAIRRIICRGGQPVFAQGYSRPELEELDEACAKWEVPLIGAVRSKTTSQFVAGVVEDGVVPVLPGFQAEGDLIVLLGESKDNLNGSVYLQQIIGVGWDELPPVRLNREKRLQQLLFSAVQRGLLKSARSCAEGGVALALANCCANCGFGATVKLRALGLRPDALLFGETPSRVIVSVAPENLQALQEMGMNHRVFTGLIGRVEGERLSVSVASQQWLVAEGKELIDLPVKEMTIRWRS